MIRQERKQIEIWYINQLPPAAGQSGKENCCDVASRLDQKDGK